MARTLVTTDKTTPLQTSYPTHVLGLFLYSKAAGARLMRILVAVVGILFGLLSLGGPLDTLRDAAVYEKDLPQEYTLARSLVSGVDPYSVTQPALTAHFLHTSNTSWYPLPTAHPATAG